MLRLYVNHELLQQPPAIQSLINKKNIRFSKKSKNKTSDNISKYNDAKEKMDKAIEKGKEKYYKSLLDNTDNSTRKKWGAKDYN